MIQANVCAAETLEAKRTPLVYRVHEEPSEEKIAALGNFLPTIGLKWTKGEKITGARFNRLLADVKDTENEHLVNEMVLRTQAQARYSNENLGHFGLNLQRYAHFTSPIRRYSDLIVHRAPHPRAEPRARWRNGPGHGAAGGAGRARHHDRAALHGGRARGDGPLSRDLHGRPHRRGVRRPHRRRHARGPVRAPRREWRGWFHPGSAPVGGILDP